MKITSITILLSFTSLFFIIRMMKQLKKDRIGIRSALIWICMWSSIGFFSLFPNILDYAMRLSQMENRMFFITVIALFILFAIIFNLTTKLEKAQRNVAKLIQEIAIANYKIKKLNTALESKIIKNNSN